MRANLEGLHVASCQFLENGCCRVVAEITDIPIDRCATSQQACAACANTRAPFQLNEVTASLAVMAAKSTGDGAVMARVRQKVNHAIAVERSSAPPKPATGPGSELKRILLRLGIKEQPGCQCASRAREMDHKGADWCRENIDTIVGWLREEAEKQSLPFFDLAARAMIRYAIHRASRS